MRTLGLIGGISWVSTIDYYRLLNEGVNRRLGGSHYAQLLLYSFDYAEIQSYTHPKNWDGLFTRVSGVTKILVDAGAEGFVLCANTMHVIADRLQETLGVPILHIAEATADKIEAAGLDHVALLGTRYTMEMEFFHERLARRGIKTTIPEDDDRGFIHHTIFNELDRGQLLPESKARYLKIIDELAAKGVGGVILGCTEIPLLVKQTDCALPLFDTTVIHAERAIEFALGDASPLMIIHLVDGTYELFRYFYSPGGGGGNLRAVRGVVGSMLSLLESDATHLGVATDHVVESFRNQMWAGYKTGEGIDPKLYEQFGPLEEALESLGVTVWPMVKFEADDALASAAQVAAADKRVKRVLICSPDKDLAQCVRGKRVVQLDRRKNEIRDDAGVVEKFGVPPASIADWLALVGDTADGFPGMPGWGEKSASTVLARYKSVDAIPAKAADWKVTVRGAEKLAAALEAGRKEALLFRSLATLRTDVKVGAVDDWEWKGPKKTFAKTAETLRAPKFAERAAALAGGR